ncbi:hypothetical protein [Lysinibacillus sp. SGAir0095]|uniref:hypothetical protein n=1 Tax=Lysinibacillus sp. SGAir0095 TaxID=2070463 RepID=UPI0010CCC145|nr:hypothetical protein [Lysinibacillus sp. SGAir0095]QCR31969.1 hypothetical protein C1N55_07190 [Lysinibacillus sp. SGAir0095]
MKDEEPMKILKSLQNYVLGSLGVRVENVNFGKQCSIELEKLVGGYNYSGDLFFSLEDLKHLSKIIPQLNYIDGIVISPFHITDESIMEAYWRILSIKVVDVVQDKNIVLLSETGKSSLEEVDKDIVEQWDNTYYEILKGDVKGLLSVLNRYISFMEYREVSLREEYDRPNQKNQGIYYQIY